MIYSCMVCATDMAANCAFLEHRLGIEIAKTMSLNYSNQETSVTIGESVRDEDGTQTYTPHQSCSSLWVSGN